MIHICIYSVIPVVIMFLKYVFASYSVRAAVRTVMVQLGKLWFVISVSLLEAVILLEQ